MGAESDRKKDPVEERVQKGGSGCKRAAVVFKGGGQCDDINQDINNDIK